MATRVEADRHVRLHEPLHILLAYPRVVRVGAELLLEAIGHGRPFIGAHVLDRQRELVDRRPCRDADKLRKAFEPPVERSLQPLPPVRQWTVERRARQKECRMRVRTKERWQRKRHVTGDVVVEGDRHRKAFPASPPPRGFEEVSRVDDAIATPEMFELPLEGRHSVRSNDLTSLVSLDDGDAVVQEPDSHAAARTPQRGLHGGRNGDTERRDERAQGTLFPRRSTKSIIALILLERCRNASLPVLRQPVGLLRSARRPELKLEVRDPARLQQEQRGKPQSAVAEQRATGGGDVAETAVAECDREIHPRGLKASSARNCSKASHWRHRGGRRR